MYTIYIQEILYVGDKSIISSYRNMLLILPILSISTSKKTLNVSLKKKKLKLLFPKEVEEKIEYY